MPPCPAAGKQNQVVVVLRLPVAFHLAAGQEGLDDFGRASILGDKCIAHFGFNDKGCIEARFDAIIDLPVHIFAQWFAGVFELVQQFVARRVGQGPALTFEGGLGHRAHVRSHQGIERGRWQGGNGSGAEAAGGARRGAMHRKDGGVGFRLGKDVQVPEVDEFD